MEQGALESFVLNLGQTMGILLDLFPKRGIPAPGAKGIQAMGLSHAFECPRA
jgi:hypothetical protein